MKYLVFYYNNGRKQPTSDNPMLANRFRICIHRKSKMEELLDECQQRFQIPKELELFFFDEDGYHLFTVHALKRAKAVFLRTLFGNPYGFTTAFLKKKVGNKRDMQRVAALNASIKSEIKGVKTLVSDTEARMNVIFPMEGDKSVRMSIVCEPDIARGHDVELYIQPSKENLFLIKQTRLFRKENRQSLGEGFTELENIIDLADEELHYRKTGVVVSLFDEYTFETHKCSFVKTLILVRIIERVLNY